VSRTALWCLLANVIGGSTFLAMAAADSSGLPAVTFSFIRTALSTLLFLVLLSARRELAPRFSGRDWLLLFLVAVPGFALPLVMGIRGVAWSSPAMGSILALLEPVAIVPLSLLFLGERMPAARWLGLLIGLGGALLVVLADPVDARADAAAWRLGNVLLAVQGSLWAIYTVAAKPLVSRHSALKVSGYATALGCVALGVVAPLEWNSLRPAALDSAAASLGLASVDDAVFLASIGAALPALLYLAICGSFLAVLLWNAGLAGVPASRMAAFIFVQPAVGVLANLVLGEPLPPWSAWLGLGLIGAAVLFVSREETTSGAGRADG
jgi:drug/metabolite transporter (DMT)-like permease